MHNIFSVKHYLIKGKRIGTSGRRSSGRRSGRRLLAMTQWPLFSSVFSFFSRFFPPFFFSSVATFSHRRSARIKKLILRKLLRMPKKVLGRHLSRPRQPFWGPLADILDFAGGAALQAVSECPRRRQAGIFLTNITSGLQNFQNSNNQNFWLSESR